MKRNDPTVLAKNAKIRKSRSWYQNLAKRGQIRANPSSPPVFAPPAQFGHGSGPLSPASSSTAGQHTWLTPERCCPPGGCWGCRWTPCLVVMRAILQNSKLYFLSLQLDTSKYGPCFPSNLPCTFRIRHVPICNFLSPRSVRRPRITLPFR